MTHTPGPWTIENINRVVGPESENIALVSTSYDERKGSTPTDNAKLIAAAPDLLAALDDMISLVDAKPIFAKVAIDNARAAIAKAT